MDTELRQRSITTKDEKTSQLPDNSTIKARLRHEDRRPNISILDIFRLLFGVLLLNTLLSYYITSTPLLWGYNPWFLNPKTVKTYLKGPLLLTPSELASFDGSDPLKPIYLALNSTIYDVTAGRNYYGPGASYDFFSGRDASRAFITGCFNEDLTGDLRGVEKMYIPKSPSGNENEEISDEERETALGKVREVVEHWQKVFSGQTGKAYFEVGRVVKEKNWEVKEPMRKLCDRAEGKRLKRS